MMGQLTLVAVFPLAYLTGKLLLRSPTFLGRTSRNVHHQSRFLGKGGPAVWTGAKPSLVFLRVLPQVPLQAVALRTLITLEPGFWGQMGTTICIYPQLCNHTGHISRMHPPCVDLLYALLTLGCCCTHTDRWCRSCCPALHDLTQ